MLNTQNITENFNLLDQALENNQEIFITCSQTVTKTTTERVSGGDQVRFIPTENGPSSNLGGTYKTITSNENQTLQMRNFSDFLKLDANKKYFPLITRVHLNACCPQPGRLLIGVPCDKLSDLLKPLCNLTHLVFNKTEGYVDISEMPNLENLSLNEIKPESVKIVNCTKNGEQTFDPAFSPKLQAINYKIDKKSSTCPIIEGYKQALADYQKANAPEAPALDTAPLPVAETAEPAAPVVALPVTANTQSLDSKFWIAIIVLILSGMSYYLFANNSQN